MKIKKIHLKNIAWILVGLWIIFGCAKKQITQETVTVPAPTPPQPQVVSQPAPAPQPTPSSPPASPSPETSPVSQPIAAIVPFDDSPIYFDFDKSDLRPEAIQSLDKKAEWLGNHPEYSLRIEGHCDERGTAEYNLALGDRRADAAMKYLNSLGVLRSKISTISYGEERPIDPGHNEEAWAKNRRDEFYVQK